LSLFPIFEEFHNPVALQPNGDAVVPEPCQDARREDLTDDIDTDDGPCIGIAVKDDDISLDEESADDSQQGSGSGSDSDGFFNMHYHAEAQAPDCEIESTVSSDSEGQVDRNINSSPLDGENRTSGSGRSAEEHSDESNLDGEGSASDRDWNSDRDDEESEELEGSDETDEGECRCGHCHTSGWGAQPGLEGDSDSDSTDLPDLLSSGSDNEVCIGCCKEAFFFTG
jgi:hypothetical protein